MSPDDDGPNITMNQQDCMGTVILDLMGFHVEIVSVVSIEETRKTTKPLTEHSGLSQTR